MSDGPAPASCFINIRKQEIIHHINGYFSDRIYDQISVDNLMFYFQILADIWISHDYRMTDMYTVINHHVVADDHIIADVHMITDPDIIT